MSETFLFYKLTITPEFYLHLLIGLISSMKYWRVAKKLVPIFRGNPKSYFQVKFLFLWNLYKNTEERRKIELSKNVKN